MKKIGNYAYSVRIRQNKHSSDVPIPDLFIALHNNIFLLLFIPFCFIFKSSFFVLYLCVLLCIIGIINAFS